MNGEGFHKDSFDPMRLNLPRLLLQMAMRNELYLKGKRAQKPTAATLHIGRRVSLYSNYRDSPTRSSILYGSRQ